MPRTHPRQWIYLSIVGLAIVAVLFFLLTRDAQEGEADSNRVIQTFANQASEACADPVQRVELARQGFSCKAIEEAAERVEDGADPVLVPGPQGERGTAGPRGFTGSSRADGEIGPRGPSGPAGKAGEPGLPGPTGDVGPGGPRGEDGSDGADGPKGDVGPAGPAGPQGARGENGPRGEAGPQGPAGPAGADSTVPGPAGATGPAGAPGQSAYPFTFSFTVQTNPAQTTTYTVTCDAPGSCSVATS